MAVTEITRTFPNGAKISVIKRADMETMDDDLRRLVISMLNLLKRKYAKDYNRIIADEISLANSYEIK